MAGTLLNTGVSAQASHPATPPSQANLRTILVVGDSLSAAYGLATSQGWVALLQRRLQEQRWPYRAENASISGDTTFGGATRLPDLLARHKPAVVVIELGANDALRGLAPDQSCAQLQRMIESSQAIRARVLLVGVPLPPNYGAFAQRMQDVLQALSKQYRVPLVPSLFKGFETRRDWFQEDGLHPKAIAQPAMLETVWPALSGLLSRR